MSQQVLIRFEGGPANGDEQVIGSDVPAVIVARSGDDEGVRYVWKRGPDGRSVQDGDAWIFVPE